MKKIENGNVTSKNGLSFMASKIRGKNETFNSPRNSARNLFTGNFFVE